MLVIYILKLYDFHYHFHELKVMKFYKPQCVIQKARNIYNRYMYTIKEVPNYLTLHFFVSKNFPTSSVSFSEHNKIVSCFESVKFSKIFRKKQQLFFSWSPCYKPSSKKSIYKVLRDELLFFELHSFSSQYKKTTQEELQFVKNGSNRLPMLLTSRYQLERKSRLNDTNFFQSLITFDKPLFEKGKSKGAPTFAFQRLFRKRYPEFCRKGS